MEVANSPRHVLRPASGAFVLQLTLSWDVGGMNGRFFHRTHFLFALERMFNEDAKRVSGMNFM